MAQIPPLSIIANTSAQCMVNTLVNEGQYMRPTYIIEHSDNLSLTYEVTLIAWSGIVIIGSMQLIERGRVSIEIVYSCNNEVTDAKTEKLLKDGINKFLKDIKKVAEGSLPAREVNAAPKVHYKRYVALVFLVAATFGFMRIMDQTNKEQTEREPLDLLLHKQSDVIRQVDSAKLFTVDFGKAEKRFWRKKYAALAIEFDSLENALAKKEIYASSFQCDDFEENGKKFQAELEK